MSKDLAPPQGAPGRAALRPFVGRARELEELRVALDDAGEGLGRLFLVSGEPGIGKTRLLQEVAREAVARGWQVAPGRCWEHGGAPAYWPWIQAVRALGGDLERLAAAASGAVDPETTRFRLFDAAAEFLVGVARARPLVVALDDLHAADSPSLVLLRFVSEAVADAPVLVVGSYREHEAQAHERPELFADLVRVATRVSLQGLGVDDVREYLAALTGKDPSRSAASHLHVLSGGNPFFVGEAARLMVRNESGELDPVGRVPEEVRTLLRQRLSGLSEDAVEPLRVAAVVGREFGLGVLQRTSELSVGRLLDVLAEAEDAGVISEDPAVPRRYAFVHELIRETLYEDLALAKRLELHHTIGAVLEELYRNDLDPHLSEIAHHLALAAPIGDVGTAIDYLMRAGDRAASLLAHEDAAGHYERALGLLGAGGGASGGRRCELLLRLGDARWRAGDTRAARASFEEAVQLARRLGDGEMLARAALGYVIGLGGFLLFARFEVGATGVGLLEEALAALPAEDSPLRARLLSRLAVEMYSSNEVERRLEVSTEAIEMARRLGDSEALVTALHARHWALGAPEMVHERLEKTEEMLAVAAELRNEELAFLAHNSRFHCFLELCDGPGIDAEIAAITELAERIQQPFYRWHGVCLQVIRATLDGRFDDAERLAREALRIARLRHSEYATYIYEYAQVVTIRWAQGRLDEYWPAIDDHGERFLWVPRWRDALAAAERGDRSAAAAELARHGGSGFEEIPRDLFWLLRLCSLAEACVVTDDDARARRLYELLLPFGDRNAVSYTQQPFGPVALRLATLAAKLERWDEAERNFETALACCGRLGARAIRARVLLEYARALQARSAAGDTGRAAALLEEARRMSEDLGLAGILRRAAAIASAAGSGDGEARFAREGEFWTLAYAGETVNLRDVKGLRYIACLLAGPGKEVHVLELVSAVEGWTDGAGRARAVGDGVRAGQPADLGPILDARAREEYRVRLDELRADLEEARGFGDDERAAPIEEEIDALVGELARALGLGGRDRPQSSPAERARVNVTKAIRTAIKLIERQSPVLAEHLTASIRTGRFCSYAPPGEAPPAWRL
ncbi:MAG TPA: AAA family ATPase [Thermoleophilaceae bacterium]|nr:AAA family ATPase [Thermoleophilaceae bacterium]